MRSLAAATPLVWTCRFTDCLHSGPAAFSLRWPKDWKLANTSVKVFNVAALMTDFHAGHSAEGQAHPFSLDRETTSVSCPVLSLLWRQSWRRSEGLRTVFCSEQLCCEGEVAGRAYSAGIVAFTFWHTDKCEMYYQLHMRHACAVCVCAEIANPLWV